MLKKLLAVFFSTSNTRRKSTSTKLSLCDRDSSAEYYPILEQGVISIAKNFA